MDFNQLSLVLFGLNGLFYLAMTFAILSKPNIIKFFIVFLAWIVQQAGYVAYGLITDQIGFVLIGLTEIIIVLLLFVISGRIVNDNLKS